MRTGFTIQTPPPRINSVSSLQSLSPENLKSAGPAGAGHKTSLGTPTTGKDSFPSATFTSYRLGRFSAAAFSSASLRAFASLYAGDSNSIEPVNFHWAVAPS